MSTNLNVNIDAEAVISQSEQESFSPNKNKTKFNPKNYLNARLGTGEQSKKLRIRLLPFSPEGGSPFQKVFIHTIKANEGDGSRWRTFICPKHNKKGDKCPFCETSEQAKQLRLTTDNEVEKKKYGDVEFMNRAKEAWIVRCIERDHEEDGVKFWMFNASRKKDGVYDKIINLFNERWTEAKSIGQEYNIFDLNNGKDLSISLSRDSNNKTVVQVTDASMMTPLSNDYEQAKSWIDDDKKWDDVYTVKPYDYMAIIVQGGMPVFDKTQNKYVDELETDQRSDAENVEELQNSLTEQKKDFSQMTDNALRSNSHKTNMFVDESDIPF